MFDRIDSVEINKSSDRPVITPRVTEKHVNIPEGAFDRRLREGFHAVEAQGKPVALCGFRQIHRIPVATDGRVTWIRRSECVPAADRRRKPPPGPGRQRRGSTTIENGATVR